MRESLRTREAGMEAEEWEAEGIVVDDAARRRLARDFAEAREWRYCGLAGDPRPRVPRQTECGNRERDYYKRLTGRR